jgi:hydrogenase maturation factor
MTVSQTFNETLEDDVIGCYVIVCLGFFCRIIDAVDSRIQISSL